LLQLLNDVDCDSPILIAQNIVVGDNQKLVQTNTTDARHIMKTVETVLKNAQQRHEESTRQLTVITNHLQEAKVFPVSP